MMKTKKDKEEVMEVEGGVTLYGEVDVSGSKNATLPLMAAAILTGGVRIEGAPHLLDVVTMSELLESLGGEVRQDGEILSVSFRREPLWEAPYEIVSRMRASICVLGPLLARCGRARVALPGGCAIGHRPVDLHIKGMRSLGADVRLEGGYIVAEARRLCGGHIHLAGPAGPSVLATANTMMAAVLAYGVTVIEPAACEPEIVALADFLVKAGARIKGAGTPRITVEGVRELRPVSYRVIPDRIEAGTLLLAGAITRGCVTVKGCVPAHLTALLDTLSECGFSVETTSDEVSVSPPDRTPNPVAVVTSPYPGFPTDLQAQIMAMLATVRGISTITESVFPERFQHIAELCRLGARIRKNGSTVLVEGGGFLTGAEVRATDLRAGAALVLAGLVAEGRTIIRDLHHIDRGYEDLCGKLSKLGAVVHRRAA